MADATLNWAEATVEDGTLRVPLAGEVPKGWKGHFETTVGLLGRQRWGKAQLKKKVVHVGQVNDGDANDLRFYLEGLVDQANAAAGADRETESDKKDSSADQPQGPDAELTGQFRAFAESGADGASQEPDGGDSPES